MNQPSWLVKTEAALARDKMLASSELTPNAPAQTPPGRFKVAMSTLSGIPPMWRLGVLVAVVAVGGLIWLSRKDKKPQEEDPKRD